MRAEELCNRYEFCPSGDCDICRLFDSDEMHEAERCDEIEKMLEKAEWFNGNAEESADRIYEGENEVNAILPHASISSEEIESIIGRL